MAVFDSSNPNVTDDTIYKTPMFFFEEHFDRPSFYKWMVENWSLSLWYSVVYVLVVFGGRYYMEDKPRFSLRLPLTLWSCLLAVFSIFGAVRTIPELFYVLKNYGYHSSVCHPAYFFGPTGFWAYIFTISKAYELGDTIFIVLRKQPLIFLHWYHHVTVFIYVWYSYTEYTAPGRWFMVMNFVVHSFMYTYYAFRAMGYKLPKICNIFITTLQISQMIGGMIIVLSSYQYKKNNMPCQQSDGNINFCFMMYASYFVLFVMFFHNAYIKSINATTPPKTNGVHVNGVEKKKE